MTEPRKQFLEQCPAKALVAEIATLEERYLRLAALAEQTHAEATAARRLAVRFWHQWADLKEKIKEHTLLPEATKPT